MTQNHRHRVIVTSGLGNQLFQFAFGHYIAKKLKSRILIENKPTSGSTPHVKFLLDDLMNFCTHIDLKKHFTIGHDSLIERFLYRSKLAGYWENFVLKNKNYIKITDSDIHLFVPSNKKSTIENYSFDGFWQDWKFVDLVSTSVIEDLITFLDKKIIMHNQHKSIFLKNLVIHIRRGDYLYPRFKGFFGVIKTDSYLPVIKQIKLENPGIIITTLTDDIDLLKKENIGMNFGTIIDPRQSNPWEALKIMTNADYLITANSSLSWWGGYLCMNKGGVVYVPKPWFQNENAPKFEHYMHPQFNIYEANFY